MCGIVGFYKKNNSNFKIKRNDIYRSLKKIKHRGPDSSGTFISQKDGIALGHNRLSIQDLSKEANQPMHSKNKEITLVFNGEIYNFQEIKKELKSKTRFNWKSNSDTEVILNNYLFEKYRKKNSHDFISKLNGIFSFALWDSNKKELLLARDALGVKPLYYAETSEGFYFASEIKALPALGMKLTSINHVAINNYLSYIWSPGVNTPEAKVYKMEPGELIIIKNGKIKSKYSWYKINNKIKKVKSSWNEKDLILETTKLIRNAVHKQMVSDVPVGAFLSGGLDSSTVVKFAKEINTNLNCFTIKSSNKSITKNDGFAEDYPYALKVSKYLDVPLNVIEVEQANLISRLEEMVYQLDEPLADPASLNLFMISSLARKKGFKVLLSGTGGDDIFSGYRRHIAIKNEKYWSWLPKNSRFLLNQLSNNLPKNKTYLRRISKLFDGSHLDTEERIINYFRWVNQEDLDLLYTDKFKKKLNSSSIKNPFKEYLNSLPSEKNKLEKMLALEQRFFLADHNLIYTDKMSMQTGVEVRVPLLDIELVEFVNQLPTKYKIRGITPKWLLKKVMENYLPRNIIYRPKTGFGVPLRDWLKNDLKDWTKEKLSKKNLSEYGIFNYEQVSKLIEDNNKGIKDTSFTILSIICIEIWLKKFLN